MRFQTKKLSYSFQYFIVQMWSRLTKYIFSVFILMTVSAVTLRAQFRTEAFQQTYNDPGDTLSTNDTTEKIFSFKEFFGGLGHKNTMKAGTLFAGSIFLPGSSQIYNRDYWKLPIVYGGIGTLAGFGGYYMHRYNRASHKYSQWESMKLDYESQYKMPFPLDAPQVSQRDKNLGTWLLAGAGLVYWASLMDGVACYQSDKSPDPGRATVYSILLPGLGQIYNGELYKVPIYWGGLAVCGYFLYTNDVNYKRYKRIHNEATSSDPEIAGNCPIPGETAKYYRDVYRRYRDYSIVATVLVYLLQVIDANVFSYMQDFEVDDNIISLNISPAVISPDCSFAMRTAVPGTNAFGVKLGLRF